MGVKKVLVGVGAVAAVVAIGALGNKSGPTGPADADECAGNSVQVPDMVGLSLTTASPALQVAKLTMGDQIDATGQGRHVLDRDNWRIVAQTPDAGACVELYANGYAGRRVSFRVVKYTDPVAPGGTTLVMPSYTGKDLKSAKADARLMVSYKNQIETTDLYGSPSDRDRVVSTSPAAGEPLTGTIKFDVVDPEVWDFFQGNPTMPDLTGKKWNYGIGFPTGPFKEVTEHTPPRGYYWGDHVVTHTVPAAGQPLVVGQRITVYTDVKADGRMPTGRAGSGAHQGVTPGAFCKKRDKGEYGYSDTGKRYVCTTSGAGSDQPKWMRA
ncbi:PASTA domain-containing protein [Micromonospora sp. NPDC007271]|uniref:PASTA domain-containing protein n=1 Tax=Micromonospora sp. NPDC007271 TaxID=3154587 RepID=UPI003404418D